jgi:hypothetical protein
MGPARSERLGSGSTPWRGLHWRRAPMRVSLLPPAKVGRLPRVVLGCTRSILLSVRTK